MYVYVIPDMRNTCMHGNVHACMDICMHADICNIHTHFCFGLEIKTYRHTT